MTTPVALTAGRRLGSADRCARHSMAEARSRLERGAAPARMAARSSSSSAVTAACTTASQVSPAAFTTGHSASSSLTEGMARRRARTSSDMFWLSLMCGLSKETWISRIHQLSQLLVIIPARDNLFHANGVFLGERGARQRVPTQRRMVERAHAQGMSATGIGAKRRPPGAADVKMHAGGR